MQLSTSFLALLASLASAAPAGLEARGAGSNASSRHCYTRYANTKAAHVTTSYCSTHLPCTRTVEVCTTVTHRPAPYMTTSTTTVTSSVAGPTSVSTGTTTVTVTSFGTSITTLTSTTPTTLTVPYTATSTVAASAGFVPVQESLPGLSCDATCGDDPVSRRELPKRAHGQQSSAARVLAKLQGAGKSYVQGVTCQDVMLAQPCHKVTSTHTETVTAKPRTSTITAATTVTITGSAQSAATTVTDTSTVATTPVTTVTAFAASTVTQSESVGSTTVYAACATNNMADIYLGVGVVNLASPSTNPGVDVTNTNSPYDCCVAALTDPNVGAAWEWGSYQCVIITNNGQTCTSQQANPLNAQAEVYGGPFEVVGNANCGIINQGAIFA